MDGFADWRLVFGIGDVSLDRLPACDAGAGGRAAPVPGCTTGLVVLSGGTVMQVRLSATVFA